VNERIFELIQQQNGDCGLLWTEEDKEKFAELIVRECANVAADHDALDIYEEIREHFGVEQ
jgi:hypothetical protein